MTTSGLVLRPGVPDDAEVCGRICYETFARIATQHGFAPDFPSPEMGIAVVSSLLARPAVYSVVAELGGRVVGSNFVDEGSTIAGIGPITVDYDAQDSGVGRALMLAVLERTRKRGFPGLRLLQAAYHTRSLALYIRLGFDVREPIVTLQGEPIAEAVPGYEPRPAAENDLAACNAVCHAVHGHDRAGDLRDALTMGSPRVVGHGGRVTGYTTGISFFGHSVGETDAELRP